MSARSLPVCWLALAAFAAGCSSTSENPGGAAGAQSTVPTTGTGGTIMAPTEPAAVGGMAGGAADPGASGAAGGPGGSDGAGGTTPGSGGTTPDVGGAGPNIGGNAGAPTGVGGQGGLGGDNMGAAGAGEDPAAAFIPCDTEPDATPPALTRGPAINGFQGMQTAGQMVGVPGEPGILYVIGHRDGNVFTVQDGTVVAAPLTNVSVANSGDNEQGLLSMALHPDFATNQLFYLFYNASSEDMTIDEFRRTSTTTATLVRNIYRQPRDGACCFHNGGSLAFNPKDASPLLYVSIGNNQGNNAGNPVGTAGRVLRIDLTTQAFTTFAYGFRNPYRMSIDRLTGDMYIADVANGPGGTIIFNEFGMTGVDYLYRNNNGQPDVNEGVIRDSNGLAIIGGHVYRGNKIPGLCGRYFYANHQGGVIKSIVVTNGVRVGNPVTHTTLSVPGNITTFGEDGEGELYMGSLTGNAIYKIEPAQ